MDGKEKIYHKRKMSETRKGLTKETINKTRNPSKRGK
jgi:hypothetical protein